MYCAVSAWHDMQPLLELKTQPRVCPVAHDGMHAVYTPAYPARGVTYARIFLEHELQAGPNVEKLFTSVIYEYSY